MNFMFSETKCNGLCRESGSHKSEVKILSKNEKAKKTVKTISFMAIIILMAKFLGLLREVLIASVYGQGYASDVLNASAQIPLLFFDMVLGVAILSTFVPVFNQYLERDGKERAIRFANNFMTVVAVITAVITLLGVVFAKPLVTLMFHGYTAEKITEIAGLLRILFPSIIFTAVAYVAVGILQSFGEFNIPSLISFVSNLVMILYLAVFRDKLGLVGVTVSMLVAWALQLFIQIPSLYKQGYRYHFSFDLKDPGLLEAAKLALPILISSWVQPLCVVINMAFGSTLGDGAVSGLNWANKIYIIMVGVFAYAITNFIFPKLSRLHTGEDSDGFAQMTRVSVGWITYIIVFVAALFLALPEPIIRVVFEHGEFTAENTNLTAMALFYYSFGMIGYAVCEVLNKSFYAIHDGKTPMITSMVGIAVNFGMAALLVGLLKMGVGGLALAAAVSSLVMAVLLLAVMNRRRKGVITQAFIWNLVKTIFCGIFSFLTARVIYTLTDSVLGNSAALTLMKLCLASLPALLVYFILSFVLRIEEQKSITSFFRKDKNLFTKEDAAKEEEYE